MEAQDHSPAGASDTMKKVGKLTAQLLAWVLIVLGLAAFSRVFPITLRGFEGFGVESGLVTLWVCLYAIPAGIGTSIIFSTNKKNLWIPRIVLALYCLLLAAVLIAAFINAEPA